MHTILWVHIYIYIYLYVHTECICTCTYTYTHITLKRMNMHMYTCTLVYIYASMSRYSSQTKVSSLNQEHYGTTGFPLLPMRTSGDPRSFGLGGGGATTASKERPRMARQGSAYGFMCADAKVLFGE